MLTLVNETDHEAQLVRMILDAQRAAAVVVVKSTYDVAGPRPVLSKAQRPVLMRPLVEDEAEFEPEGVLGKLGVDLLVVGAAVGDGRTQLGSVAVRIEQWASQLLVFGDRVWRRSMLRWTASDPQPFVELPVAWSTAFGGVGRLRGAPRPNPDNPLGKGYLLDVDGEAEGAALPNIEDPGELVTEPGQVVRPICFAPLPRASGLRVAAALVPGEPAGVNKAIFNVAHPRHRLPALRGGERCEVHGWCGMPAEVFELPREAFVVEVDIEDRRYEFVPAIDTVCLWPRRRQLVVTRRATFTYRYCRGAARAARLRSRGSHVEFRHAG